MHLRRSGQSAALAASLSIFFACGQVVAVRASDSQSADEAKVKREKQEKFATATANFEIDAPRELVWKTLTNFSDYPDIFSQIRSCKVTKQDGDLIYTESYLKPQMFLKQPCQHTVNDLSGKPAQLTWKLIDGNFKSVCGSWQLKPVENDTRCKVVYIISVDAGPFIPRPLTGILLKMMQKEAVCALKTRAETLMQERQKAAKTANSQI